MDEIAKLPANQREIVKLWVQGVSEREIGKQMGVSGVRVHHLKRQALATLRAALENF